MLAALDQAGIAAHRDKSPWRDDPAESALGWVEAETHHIVPGLGRIPR